MKSNPDKLPYENSYNINVLIICDKAIIRLTTNTLVRNKEVNSCYKCDWIENRKETVNC